MIRRRNVALLVCALAVSSLSAAFAWRTIPQKAFGSGEELVYDVGWKAATAGELTLRVLEKGTRQNRSAFKVLAQASTNSTIDLLFPVRDQFVSWIDVNAITSLGFASKISEGDIAKSQEIFISPSAGTYKIRSVRPKKSSKADVRQGTAPAYTQDLVSVLYYVRANPPTTGKPLEVTVLSGNDLITIRFVVRREETIETVVGATPCWVIEPLFKSESGFGPHPHASGFVWLSKDARHLPVKISVELPIGHVDATLSRYKAR